MLVIPDCGFTSEEEVAHPINSGSGVEPHACLCRKNNGRDTVSLCSARSSSDHPVRSVGVLPALRSSTYSPPSIATSEPLGFFSMRSMTTPPTGRSPMISTRHSNLPLPLPGVSSFVRNSRRSVVLPEYLEGPKPPPI